LVIGSSDARLRAVVAGLVALAELAAIAHGAGDGEDQEPLPCSIYNGGMEYVAPSQQPEGWQASDEVRSSPRAHSGGRGVVLKGAHSTLGQQIAIRRDAALGARLSFWVLRDETLDSFNLSTALGTTLLPVVVNEDTTQKDTWVRFEVDVPTAALRASDAALTFIFTRRGSAGFLDIDDVELDLCAPATPTPPPTGDAPTAVPDHVTCAVRNGGFEFLEGVRPRHWAWTGDVESSAVAAQGGQLAVRFLQGSATLTQELTNLDDWQESATLRYWLLRDSTAAGFQLIVRAGTMVLYTHNAALLPYGGHWASLTVPMEAKPASGPLVLTFEWHMPSSGAVYLDEVALDLCGSVAQPTVTPADSPTPPDAATPTATVLASPSPTPSPSAGITPTRATATAETSETVSPTPTVEAGASPTATGPATAEGTSPATPTDTPGVTPSPSATLTRAPTPGLPEPIYLPYGARGASLAGARPRVWGLQFGLEEPPASLPDNLLIELPRAKRAGLTSVRTTLRWDWLEPANTTPESYDWTEADRRLAEYSSDRYGNDLLVGLIAYPKWATVYACGYALQPGMEPEWRQFVRAVAERYSRPPYRVVAWEIGNEVDGKTTINDDDRTRPPGWGQNEPTVPIGGCWGDRAAAYRDFLRAAYEEIKAVDPDALVTLGSLAYAFNVPEFHTDFLEQLLAAGGGPYFDFLGFHWFPNVLDQPTGPDKVGRLIATLRRYGQPKPLWLTETYRLTFPGLDWTTGLQIEFLTKELVEVLAFNEIVRIYWYGWVDYPVNYKRTPTEGDRGLVTVDHRPKPALDVLPYTVLYTNGLAEDISTRNVIAYRFSWPRTAGTTIIAWSRSGRQADLTVPASDRSLAQVSYFPRNMLLAGDCCGTTIVPPQNGSYRFGVGSDALFIRVASR
jgi:hypothetical protein